MGYMKFEVVVDRPAGYYLRPRHGVEGGLDLAQYQTPKKPVVAAPNRRPNPDEVGTSLTDAEINKPLATYAPWQR